MTKEPPPGLGLNTVFPNSGDSPLRIPNRIQNTIYKHSQTVPRKRKQFRVWCVITGARFAGLPLHNRTRQREASRQLGNFYSTTTSSTGAQGITKLSLNVTMSLASFFFTVAVIIVSAVVFGYLFVFRLVRIALRALGEHLRRRTAPKRELVLTRLAEEEKGKKVVVGFFHPFW